MLTSGHLRTAQTEPADGIRRASPSSLARLIVCLLLTMVLLPLAGSSPRDHANSDPNLAHLRVALRTSRLLGVRLSEQQETATRPDPRSLHTRGLLHLLEGRPDQAILAFQALSEQAPNDARAWSDLAAAMLVRAEAAGGSQDLLLALEAGDQALIHQPDSCEALFNRAVALTRLHLRRRAAAAWSSYLQVDPSSAWSDEAREQLRILGAPTLAAQWDRVQPSLRSAVRAGDHETVRDIVSRFRGFARRNLEEQLLPAWAEAQASGDASAAEAQLTAARELAAASSVVSGDAMASDAVGEIDRAREQRGGDRLALLVRGHRGFGRGMALYRVQNLAAARPSLAGAQQALAAAGSPFADVAQLFAAICDHYAHAEAAAAALVQLRKRLDGSRYPVLAGHAEWMLGTIDHNQDRPEQALLHFRAALTLLAAAGGDEEAAFVHLLIAEVHQTLGEAEAGWRERTQALAGVLSSGDRRRIHSTLHESATALLAQGLRLPLADFLAELLANDREWGNPGALAESLVLRGQALDLEGRLGEARTTFETARELAGGMPESGQRDRIAAAIELVSGETLVEHDPEAAVTALSRAAEMDLAAVFPYPLTRLLAARAQAYERLGDTARAESDLAQAIDEHELVRGSVRQEAARISYFEKAQEAYDAMVRLQVDWHRDFARALEFADRARSRALLDLRMQQERRAAFASTPARAGQLPPADPVTLVEYAVLSDRLFTWVAGPDGLHFHETAISSSSLGRSVRRLRRLLEQRASEDEIKGMAVPLYELLIRPILAWLPAQHPVLMVPDRFLIEVPFAALFDAERGRYLIEDRAVALAPSEALYEIAHQHSRHFERGVAWTALVVGDPTFDRLSYPQLERLQYAEQEAIEVAALYPHADLLRGPEAKRGAFLDRAGHHRLVHFAGHALSHPSSPGLSRLLLAAEFGTSPGALYAWEVAGLHLDDTEVVVLSACRTLDAERGGREYVNGLAAAFLAAGPSVVISSLWSVDDDSTHRLMLAFHRALSSGSDAGTALRSAQLLMLADPALRSPADWAAFEAIGAAFD
jgi:CHAT domain-containing protein/tetratricopeptide (TPR) repeat protein